MITKMSHVTIWVKDQDAALDFYVGKLGFEVRTDAKMEGFRWLTVGSKQQPDLELVLMVPSAGPMMDESTASQIRDLMAKGALGAGVFHTDDCHKTYAELKAKGVEFLSEPKEQFYGIEALLKDNSGNWFSMTQRKQP